VKHSLYLIYHGRYPSEKAASLFAAKSAEAFADAGSEVTLIVPRRLGRVRTDPYVYFGIRKNFRTIFVPTIDIYFAPIIGRFAHQVSYLAFTLSLVIYLLLFRRRDTWVCSNESFPLLAATFLTSRTLYEVHDFPERSLWMYRLLFARARLILATNEWKANALHERFGVPREKIIVEPNAVDLTPYENAPERGEARNRLGLPLDAKIAVYTGHLYAWKGVDTLAEAAKLMPEVQVYIVGGTAHDLAQYRQRYQEPNLHFVGHKSHSEMLHWQTCADVLILPNSSKEDISSRYTSPMKLYEYMASGVPIVASNLPSVREIVNDESAIFFTSDDVVSLVSAVSKAIQEGTTTRRTHSARTSVLEHSWQNRANRILDKITHI